MNTGYGTALLVQASVDSHLFLMLLYQIPPHNPTLGLQ